MAKKKIEKYYLVAKTPFEDLAEDISLDQKRRGFSTKEVKKGKLFIVYRKRIRNVS